MHNNSDGIYCWIIHMHNGRIICVTSDNNVIDRSVIILIAFIADIHLGTKLPQMDYLKSLDKFLSLIKEHEEECVAIMVLGDLFDHRLSIDEAKFASVFMLNLVCNNCGRNGHKHVPVKFIHGTYTHDYDQYEIFLPILDKIPNTDIFYTKEACVGTLTNGMKVLYLPQEYDINKDYSDIFNNQYDIIVGHGPISSETKQPCRSSQYEVMHSVEQLGSISKLCVFGHYHGYTDFGNNIFYAGSMLRWKYGEDEPKVFFMCNDNLEVETVPNEFALQYETIDINSPEELRNELSKDINNPHRFEIHCNDDTELTEYHSIMNTYKKNQFLKYRVTSTPNVIDDADIVNVNDEDVVKEMGITPIVEPIPALVSYIKDKYSIDVTDEIKDYETKINRSME